MRISKHLKGITESQIMPMNRIQVQADGTQFTLSIEARSRVLHFPRDMVSLLRCNDDAGELALPRNSGLTLMGSWTLFYAVKFVAPIFASRMESHVCCQTSLVPRPGTKCTSATRSTTIVQTRVRSCLRPMVGGHCSLTRWKFQPTWMNCKPRLQVQFWSLLAATVASRRSSHKRAQG